MQSSRVDWVAGKVDRIEARSRQSNCLYVLWGIG